MAPCTSIEPEHRTPPASSRKFPDSFLFFVFAVLAVALAVLGLKNGELAGQLLRSKEQTRIAIENERNAQLRADSLADELDRSRKEVERSNERVQELESQVSQLNEQLRQRQDIPDTMLEGGVQPGAEP